MPINEIMTVFVRVCSKDTCKKAVGLNLFTEESQVIRKRKKKTCRVHSQKIDVVGKTSEEKKLYPTIWLNHNNIL